MHVQPYDSHAYLQAFNSRSWEPAGNTTLTDPRSQRNQVGRRGRPDNNTSSQLIRYPGLPTERAPDAPVPVARGYSQQPEISQATGGVDGVMPDNNRAENSHRPTRRRERQMQRFKSSDQAQRFLSAHAMIYGHFRPRRHLMTAADYRRARSKAFRIWRQETCVHQSA